MTRFLCRCSHARRAHTDTGGDCQSAACGCRLYRPVEEPTGIPARLDERYDPSPEPIDRKTR